MFFQRITATTARKKAPVVKIDTAPHAEQEGGKQFARSYYVCFSELRQQRIKKASCRNNSYKAPHVEKGGKQFGQCTTCMYVRSVNAHHNTHICK